MNPFVKTYQFEYHGALLLWISSFFVLFFILLTAIQQQSEEEFATYLQQELYSEKTQWPPSLLQFYEERNFQPLWIKKGELTDVALDFLDGLYKVQREGLEPEDYINASFLSHLIQIVTESARQDSAALIHIELKLSMAFLKYTHHLLRGRISAGQLHEYWTLKQRDGDFTSFMRELSNTPLSVIVNRLMPAHNEYHNLREALKSYREIARAGGWLPIEDGPTLKLGIVDERVCSLRQRLHFTCDLPHTRSDSVKIFDSTKTFDKELERAVKVFQLRHGLLTTGIVDNKTLEALNVSVEDRIIQLSLNMDRWRWIPDSLGQRHVRVNIPDYSLHAFENGELALSMKIIVGTPRTPTEMFHAEMSQVVVSPYWYVPASIAKKEVLPLLRKDTSYLTRNQMEVRFQGQTIRSDSIHWNTITEDGFPYILRQKPGPINSLGPLRFTMPNVLDIGMHGTPERYLFDRTNRAFSHGCVRLENPAGLAIFVLNDSNWTEERLEEIIEYGIEYPIEVSTPIPVYMFYFTAWVDEHGLVHFRDDVYGYDNSFIETLAEMDI